MYHVFEMDTRLTSKFVYFRKDPENFKAAMWRTGLEIKNTPLPLSFIADDEEPSEFSDILLTRVDAQIYSPKLMDTLSSAGVDNLQSFPVTVMDKKRGVTRNDYYSVNIIGCLACLDAENSEVELFPDGDGYSSVENFSLLEEKITPLPGKTTPPLLFRLAEFPYHVIAHESLKTAFEKNGITGSRMIRTQDFG